MTDTGQVADKSGSHRVSPAASADAGSRERLDPPAARLVSIGELTERLSALSEWIDAANGHRNFEAIQWGRLSKIGEEFGEVIAAFIGATGQNPRKGFTHSMADVRKELLDVAVTALGAYEHLSGNEGVSIAALYAHVDRLCARAGLT